MLHEIQTLLAARGPMTACELAIHFDMQPDAITGMLETLERKGRVERESAAGASVCGRCRGCELGRDDRAAEMTVWRVKGDPDA